MKLRIPRAAALTLLIGSSFVTQAHAQAVAQPPDGPLDHPLPGTQVVVPGQAGVSAPTLEPAPGITDEESLVRAVEREQEELEKLPRPALERKAESGERVAQVVLGADYAREAESLAFSPAAANDALANAVQWYSEAASFGFPGAPSLDTARVDFYPIRIQRAFLTP